MEGSMDSVFDPNVKKATDQQSMAASGHASRCEVDGVLPEQGEEERLLMQLSPDGIQHYPLSENVTTGTLESTTSPPPLLGNSTEPTIDESGDVFFDQLQDLGSIRDRWLYPVFSRQISTCHPDKSTVQPYGQVLRTYPQLMCRKDQLPPIIHPLQLSADAVPLPLANCFGLVRMSERRLSAAGHLVEEAVRGEMNRLFSESLTYSEIDLVAAVQALLIYAIMAFFSSNSTSAQPLVDETTIMNMQQVAYRLATTGVAAEAEKDHTRPKWEDWVRMSAKRRTILALYCFDCVFTTMNNLPTFPCDELRFMPAPAGKLLRQAQSRA